MGLFWKREQPQPPQETAEGNGLDIDTFRRLAYEPEIAEFTSRWLGHRAEPDETSNVPMSNAARQIHQYLDDKGYRVTEAEVGGFLEMLFGEERKIA